MNIKDEKVWKEWVDNNTDSYGKGVIDYAERWANLMEKKMDEGESLEDNATDTSYEANTEGITWFKYGAAVQVLFTSWERGDQLRKWHNLDTQMGNEGEKANEEGGVLNPATLTVKI